MKMQEIRCPFRFRCGKTYYCSIKHGKLHRRKVCLAECRQCDHRRAVQYAIPC
jgi:hypothetical protein